MSGTALSVGVLICSHRRPDTLLRGLAALAVQEHRPDDVMVVLRDTDHESREHIARRAPDRLALRVLTVTLPGTVAALNTGLDACCTDLLAITDDDTVPHPDWLARIHACFAADPKLGGLGGRDRCHDGERFDDRAVPVVGQIAWYGRAVGNHHIGTGGLRDVDMLKGANMSYRAAAFVTLRFDRRLRGLGAQPFEDTCFSMAVRRAGWRLRYDPRILVDHYAARRDDTRHYASIGPLVDPDGLRTYAYNCIVAYLDTFTPLRRLVFAAWAFLVGTGTMPGLVQAVRYTPSLGREAWRRFVAAQQGIGQAWRDLLSVGGKSRDAATERGGHPGCGPLPLNRGCSR